MALLLGLLLALASGATPLLALAAPAGAAGPPPAAAAPSTADSAAAVPTKPAAAAAAEFEQRVLEVLRNHPEAVFEALQTQLRRQQEQKRRAQEQALAELQRNPTAAVGSSPSRGKGKLQLIEFSDFQCPYCAVASKTLAAFLANNGSKVSLIYKHYPLTQIHAEALPAARAAWAAQQQGRFWEFHDALFAAQTRLGEPLYLETARALGLDLKRFASDRNGKASLEAIDRDRALADRLGLEGTPFFVVDGQVEAGALDEAFLQKLVQDH